MSSLGFDSAVVTSILIYAMLAYSIQAPLRAGVFSLSGIGCFAIGGYATAILTIHGVPMAFALVLSVLLAGFVNWLLSLILVRLESLYLAMATVAFVVIIGVIAANSGELTGGGVGLFGVPSVISLTGVVLLALAVSALLFLSERHVSGRSAVVAREDEHLAYSLGIDIASQRRLIFLVSGMVGGLAGACNVLTVGSIGPETAGFSMIILALTMVILGGFGSWVGAAIGALILIWLPLQISSIGDWWPVIYGVMLTGIAVYAPGGLLGLATGGRRRWRVRRRPVGRLTPNERSGLEATS